LNRFSNDFNILSTYVFVSPRQTKYNNNLCNNYIVFLGHSKTRFSKYVFLVPVLLQVMRLAGITAMLMVAGCSSQTVQPAPVQIGSSSPYFNGGFRPNGAYPQQYFGGPQQLFNGVLPPQFIGGPNVPQRFYNGQNPAYNGQFVPILQQSFDISPDGSYTFGWV